MPVVDIRWRPSGGRGEYEHVPQQVLIGRQIVIASISVPGAFLTTDVWGRIRDGKPRLRRENPNDRSLMNVPQLIAALALLPDPIREDKGAVKLPLQDKGYVISVIKVDADISASGKAVCTPQTLKILHDNNELDLVERLVRISTFVRRTDLPAAARALATQYVEIIKSGSPSAALRDVSNELARWLADRPEYAEAIEAPSEKFIPNPEFAATSIELSTLTAVEAKRRLTSHFKIDRSAKIRSAKVAVFKEANDGRVFCENCAFCFGVRYGVHGRDFIEVHHIQPLAALLPNTITNLTDLMLLCANCHRMVHRKKLLLTPAGLKQITAFYAGDTPAGSF